jgi:hypothetical protein
LGSNELKYSADGKLYIRKSMIETHSFCPRKFRIEWIEGEGIQENYTMVVGTRFHEFAYWFFDICQGIDPSQWTELVPSSFTLTERDMARWWLEKERERYEHDPDLFMPLQREIKLVDDDLCLTGTCDRIDSFGEDLIVVEYKTGASFNLDSIHRQLAFYKLLWDNTINMGNIKYMLYINPRIQKYELIEFREDAIDGVLRQIAGLRKAIREDIFPRKCSPVKHALCMLCDAEECGAYYVSVQG